MTEPGGRVGSRAATHIPPERHKSPYKYSLPSREKPYTLRPWPRSPLDDGEQGHQRWFAALIAADAPCSQTELASLVGVSQPRVFEVLTQLAQKSAISARSDGYVGKPPKLLDLYVTNHRPALVGPEAPWYGLEPMREQTEQLCAHAKRSGARVAISADLAPDLLAPWRHPTLTVVYTDAALDLTEVGFVPAEGRVDATMLVRYASDTTLLAPFEPWPREADGIPLTDPTQQVWDLHDLGGSDRAEAANRLRRRIIDRAIETAK
ncbi:MAG: hypothetical protein U5R31_14845 [Acidimicrobiia bacterium]|nr:hypothetical protein [Acidimicrobiia bacterium]